MKKLTILLIAVLISTTSFAQSKPDNVFYLRLGYSSPTWGQYGFSENYRHEYSKYGAMAEMGSIFMLKSLPLPENMAIGINVDYLSIYWHQFNDNESYNSMDIAALRLDSKIGPSFTFAPVDKLELDMYVKADISWVTASVLVYDNNYDDSDGYVKVGSLGLSAGFNVRYSILMLGVEYNTINPKLENVDNKGEYLGNAKDNSDKTPLPSLTFSIGLAF